METQPMRFEQAMDRLEEIVKHMEQGDGTLDEMLALYEEGMRLGAFCSEKLDEYEGKMERLRPAPKED
ncbi:MAG: exodeoxyribonuclease VII small subunit [Clostridia bacterium]|nr:exodeoxyribonuclease VII small subunit [Clostridia bacterium]